MSFDRFHTDDIVLWRRAEQKDVPTIVALCKRPGTRELFGNVSVPEVLELSFLSIVLETTGGQLAGSLSLHFAPNVPALPASCWEWWVREHYDMDGATASNTLFVHLLTWQSQFGSEYLESLLHAIYLSYSYLRNIVLVMPPGTTPIDVMRTLFTRVLSTTEANDAQTLLLNTRQQHVPWLNVRLATPEDNDDVVAILCRMATDLCTEYGNFFASELASREPIEEDDAEAWEPSSDVDPSDVPRTLIVAEVEERAMAVMCLSGEVDLAFLERNFDLGPYHGMRQPTEVDVIPVCESVRRDSTSWPQRALSDSLQCIPLMRGNFSRQSAESTQAEGSYLEAGRTSSSLFGSQQYFLSDLKPTKSQITEYYRQLIRHSSGSFADLEARNQQMKRKLSEKELEEIKTVHAESNHRTEESESCLSKSSFLRRITGTEIHFSSMYSFLRERLVDSSCESFLPNEEERYSSSSSDDFYFYDDADYDDDPANRADEMNTGDPEFDRIPFYLINPENLAEHIIPFNTIEEDRGSAPQQPVYFGPSNAFVVELFGVSDAYDEQLAFSLLQAAFEQFPDREFCLLMVPSTFPFFPLLHHFARVQSRPERVVGEQLFALHRCSVLAEIVVRAGNAGDVIPIRNLLLQVNDGASILMDFCSTVVQQHTCMAYVLQADHSVVGIAVLTLEQHPRLLEAQYDLAQHALPGAHAADSHGCVKHIVVSPLFEPHARFFLAEVLRLSSISSLYYKLYTSEQRLDFSDLLAVPSILDSFVPVHPRRMFHFQQEFVGEEVKPFALYFMSPRYASFPRMCVNARIVVVGLSTTALAFLEALMYNAKSMLLHFTNVMIVTPTGLLGKGSHHKARDELLVYSSHYDFQYLSRVNLRAMVHVLPGVMTDIERNQRFVVVNQNYAVPYDRLVLLCGEQFHRPSSVEDVTGQSTARYQCPHEHVTTEEHTRTQLKNVFCANSASEASHALARLKLMIGRRQHNRIIVYGRELEAYCAVQSLVTFGVAPTHIVFVKPLDDKFSCYDDRQIENDVHRRMLRLGASVYISFSMTDWKVDSNYTVTSVTFSSTTMCVRVECTAMFCYGNRSVHRYALGALQRANITSLRRVFINHKYETSDPNILSAGPMTMYKEEYFAEKMSHRYYNSVEVGQHLAKRVLLCMDPSLSEEERKRELHKLEEKGRIPRFTQPVIVFCTLPGGVKFLRVRKPGPIIPSVLEMECPTYGFDIKTGNPYNRGYLKLHLNNAHKIVGLTCYSDNQINVDSLVKLYNCPSEILKMQDKHLAGHLRNTLNHVSMRQWAAIFHDRFQAFFQNLMETLMKHADPPEMDLLSSVTRILEQTPWKIPPREEVEVLNVRFKKSSHKHTVEKKTLDFLESNADYLPIFATPRLLTMLLCQVQDSTWSVPAQ